MLYSSECIWTLTLRKYGVSNTHGKLLHHLFFILRVLMFELCVTDITDITDVTDVTDVPLDCTLLNRRMRFISGLCYVNNSSLQILLNVTAKQELIKVIGLIGLLEVK